MNVFQKLYELFTVSEWPILGIDTYSRDEKETVFLVRVDTTIPPDTAINANKTNAKNILRVDCRKIIRHDPKSAAHALLNDKILHDEDGNIIKWGFFGGELGVIKRNKDTGAVSCFIGFGDLHEEL
jgi:hypothetical protein